MTPMMQQYWDAKARYPGMLLLFRMGDFYELFGDDAERANQLLGLAVATRDKDKGPNSTKMAGFPHPALESYLKKLVEAGVRNVEIEAAFAVTDRTTGDRIWQHGGEEMQCRVHAHAGVTPVPIDLGNDAVANFGHGTARGQHMRDLALGSVGVDCRFHRNARAVCGCERPGVARLST